MVFKDDKDSPLAIVGEESGEVYDATQRLGVHRRTLPFYCRGASICMVQRVGNMQTQLLHDDAG
jgi:hypothetical protein